jgi:hypothetical protein
LHHDSVESLMFHLSHCRLPASGSQTRVCDPQLQHCDRGAGGPLGMKSKHEANASDTTLTLHKRPAQLILCGIIRAMLNAAVVQSLRHAVIDKARR